MSGTHPRNTKPMLASRRCGARTRKGTPCQAPAVAGKARCPMHGGAAGSGAPKDNRNAMKQCQYMREVRAAEAYLREILRHGRAGIEDS
ncbi:HGGxSTG domain-containing protein [Limimaricola soesokkakensis]|uniref:HGGxSTG domain-containing protein n=1 Tax=Limimaricola soesokkakensis TaxID=1343159 RepID=UPI0035173F0C